MASFEFKMGAAGEVLRQYMSCRDPVSFIRGPLGSGKTYASCQRMFTQICTQKPNAEGVRKARWIAVRNTYPDLQGTTIKDWMELFGDPELGKFTNDYPPTHRLDFALDDGTRVKAEVLFMALDRPDSVRKLRGIQATGFWLNEVKELDWAIVQMCDLRHGRYPSKAEVQGYWHGMIGDTNSPDDMHWYYRLAEETKPEGWSFFSQAGGLLRINGKWVENPKAENVENLPDGYYMRGKAGKDEDWIAVNLANEYGHVSDGKPIYKQQWNDVLHVSEYPLTPIKKHGNLFIGFDFGLTPAAVIGQLTHGRLRLLDEFTSDSMGVEFFLDEVVMPVLKTKYKDFDLSEAEVCCDPAGNSKNDVTGISPISFLNERGFNAYGAHTNKPTQRWEAVRYFLSRMSMGKPSFLLSPECVMLRRGFNGGYHLRRIQVSGTAKFAETANKNEFSHCHDALQYLCLAVRGETTSDFGTSRPTTEPVRSSTKSGY